MRRPPDLLAGIEAGGGCHAHADIHGPRDGLPGAAGVECHGCWFAQLVVKC